jgi:charged multivesicular body protein 3
MEEAWKSLKRLVLPRDPKEIVQKWRREIRKQKNLINRDIRTLQLEQKKVERSIQEAGKRNDIKSAKVLAKELVRSQHAVVRMLDNRATLDALDLQMGESLRNYRLSKTLKSSGEMMKQMNKLMRVEQFQGTVKAMSREMCQAGMLSEELNEGIDSLVDAEDTDDLAEEAVQQVLDEICGETLAAAATVPMNSVGRKERQQEKEESEEEDELMRALAAGEITR